MADSNRLEQRLQQLEDEREITRTFNLYSRALDYDTEPSRFLDCFVPTGVWQTTAENPLAGTGGVRLDGHADLERWFTNMKSRVTRVSKHFYAELDIRIDGDSAAADSYFFVPFGSESGPYFHSIGRYADKLVRCSDGRWRFQERNLHREGADPAAQKLPVG